jgi:fimbrial chaperone protein
MIAADSAVAANLQISPVSIFLRGGQQAASLQLRNLGDEPIYGQVRVYQWDQKSTEDVLTPTTEVLASPPMVQVSANSTQTIRLVRMSPTADSERSYRVLIDEIAGEGTQRASGVDFKLRYSVPVFVLPGGDGGAESLAWQVFRRDGSWMLAVRNSGQLHAQIGAMRFQMRNGRELEISKGLFGYVLAGRLREWRLPVAADIDLAGQVRIDAQVNGKPVSTELNGEVVERRQE